MDFPEMPRQRELIESVPDHEILLAFNGDEDADWFRSWLEVVGWELFLAYYDRATGSELAAVRTLVRY
jgi:hypothetical protein